MSLLTLTEKFETMTAAYAELETAKAAFEAAQAQVTTDVASNLAALITARNAAEIARGLPALLTAYQQASGAASEALTDYSADFEAFKLE